MFISKMKLLSNETSTGYETDDDYLFLCCKYFEISIVAKVEMYTTTLIHDILHFTAQFMFSYEWTCSDVIRQWRISNLLWQIYF